MKQPKFNVLFFSTILIYVIFHITEEALGKFPLFMNNNWGIPDIGYARWLYHNIIFFLPVLMIGFLIYLLDENRLYIGLGITFWGVLNFFEHTFYTIKNSAVAPGLYSSLLFVGLTVVVLVLLKKQRLLSVRLVVNSTITATVYWGISVGMVMILAPYVARIFA